MSAVVRRLSSVSLAMVSAVLPSVRAGTIGFRFGVAERRVIVFELIDDRAGREIASLLAVDGVEFDCCRLLLEDAASGRR